MSDTSIALHVDDTHIIFYKNISVAMKDAAGIKGAFKNNPGRGSVRVHDTRVYWVAQERNLTKAERTAFLKIVSISEAAL